MRYAQIREMDISNGEDVGVALFVQGCPIHCSDCFNSDTWDFNGGKEFDFEAYRQLIHLIDRPYIKRISILGGEPLCGQNVKDVNDFIHKLHLSCGEFIPRIWLYTGFVFEQMNDIQRETAMMTDVLVDGPYKKELRDMNLMYRGSSNQRLIDIKKMRDEHTDQVILYNV